MNKIDALKWRLVGPFRGGRSCAVTGVYDVASVYYMGSTGGGVWKSQDDGQSWKNISDGYFGGSIGSVSVAPSDPNQIWVGTGEETVRGNVSPGDGIWKSEDAGNTWKFMGLKNTRHISRIRIHPINPDIVYVASMGDLFKNHPDRGVFMTTDGGKNWKKVLYPSDSAGVVDLIIHPTLPKILYATSWNIRRRPHELVSGGPEGGIWKSSDGGLSWTNLRGKNGLPDGLWGISGISICYSNPDFMYAMIEHEQGGLFKSEDGGNSWKKMNESRDLRQRAWYYTRLQADPLNPQTVFVLNVNLHKSTDGGKTFQTLSVHHGDNHDLWIDPKNNNRMILGNDGGAQVTTNAGQSWSSQNNQPTAQFYRVTTDHYFPFRIYAAQQDNSTIRIAHRNERSSINSGDWQPTAGGESGHLAVDPLNPEIVYGGSYGGYLTRYDHQNKINRNIHIWPDNPIGHGAKNLKFRFQWNFPILISKHNPKRLYACSNHLHVSENEGHSWDMISPDLTRNDSNKLLSSGGPITKDNTSVEYYCTIFALAESHFSPSVIWVGSDDGLVHLTTDLGKTWRNITPPQLPQWTMINSLEADPHNPEACYLAATSYKLGDYKPYLLKTTDFGKTWMKIDKGIPEDHFTRVVRVDPAKKGLLYSGTERGMYFSLDDGLNWYSFQMNLPVVPITDIQIKDFSMVVATQGRSIWMIDDLTPVRDLDKIGQADIYFSHPKPAYCMRGEMDTLIKNAGINHPYQWMLYSFLDSLNSKDTFEILVVAKNHDTVSCLSNFPSKKQQAMKWSTGSQLILLPFKYPDAQSVEGMVMWGASLSGPLYPPGEYSLQIFKNKMKLHDDTISIIRHLNHPSSDQDVMDRFYFIKKCRDKIDEAHKVIIQIRDLKNQIKNYFDRVDFLNNIDSIKQLKNSIDSISSEIENELYQTKMKANQDPINYPIKLTNKLAHLIALYNYDAYPPTDQARQLSDELISLIDIQISRFAKLQNTELKLLNELIISHKANYILIRSID